MAIRKAFIFRGGDKINPSDKPLQHLDSSVKKIKTTLKEYGNWEVEDFVLKSSDDISNKLSSIEDNQDNEILLFYTGHGVPQPNDRYALIGDDCKEVLFDNIINPVNKFALTRFVIIIDACHSSEAEKSVPRIDNIEIVSSVARGLAYESDLFESTNFVHYFIKSITQSTKEIGSDITLEYICNSINANDEVQQKPIRVPAKHTQYRNHIVIAPSLKPITNRPVPNAPLDFPTGQVPMESIYYIARDDSKAYDMLKSDYSLIRIKAPRQYGKTSLLSRLLKEAKSQDYQIVSFNFQEFDNEMLENLDELLSYICDIISIESDIEPNVNPKLLSRLTPKMRATKYIESILSQIEKPIVLTIDEADRLFEYSDVSDEFFGLIRAWHEKSKDKEIWNRLKIILSHSTEPLLGITSINQSPFHNVGLGMSLQPFTFEEIKGLISVHNLILNDNEISKLIDYVGGHPYLIRKVLYEMADENIDLIEALSVKRFEEHLRRYLIIFQSNPNLIDTVQKVMAGDCPNIKRCYILEATGFITNSMNDIKISCKLYQEFFEKYFGK